MSFVYGECHLKSIMLSVVMVNVVKMSVIISVVAPITMTVVPSLNYS
jgi:hypothetical protein